MRHSFRKKQITFVDYTALRVLWKIVPMLLTNITKASLTILRNNPEKRYEQMFG